MSAYSGKTRPDYESLLAMIRAGAIDAVIAWHPDRLHRSPIELEAFIQTVEAHGVAVETVRAGRHDFTTANGRLMARLTGAVARSESEQKSERITRAFKQRRAAGRAHGGESYGWRREYYMDGRHRRFREVVDEDEAAVVKAIAERIPRGDSLRSIAVDLERDGIPAPGGGTWVGTGSGGFRGNAVARLVRRPRNVGLLVHQGEVVGEGNWPAILPLGLWERVCAALADPARKTTVGSASKHLLSGIGTCGLCGAVLRAATGRTGSGRRFATYRCSAKGCVSREQTFIDDYVTHVVIEALSRPDAVDLLIQERGPEAAQAADEAAALRARLDTAADDYADGKIDARQLERITARLRPRIEAAEAKARVADDTPLLDGVVGAPDVAGVWAELPLSRRRAIVSLLLTVRLDKKSRRGRGLDLDGIVVEPRKRV